MKTIKHIKSQFRQIAHDTLPYHWLESWLLFVIQKDKSFLITHDEHELPDDEFDRLTDGVNKMTNGTPLAYVMGKQGFFGHEFIVNEHTLIPRPDTEMLIQTVLDFIDDNALKNGRILDLGTGSGCIGLSLAHALPDWSVVAVDLSEQAVQVAHKNADELNIKNCQIYSSNWYENIQGDFDVIVSNPPYIAKDDEHLANLKAEPITALVADNDGLADIETIVNGSKIHLKQGGLLAIEHGFDQKNDVQKLFKQAGFDHVRTIKDYGNNDRMTLGIYHG